MYQEHKNAGFLISTDPAKLSLAVIHQYLSEESYWAKGISFSLVERSVQNSLNFGVYHQEEQVGYARVISDFATFAYLCDVFILANYRGHGLAKWLMHCILNHPGLQGLRRFMLMTRDAHGLYRESGFTDLKNPPDVMEIAKPGLYLQQATDQTPGTFFGNKQD